MEIFLNILLLCLTIMASCSAEKLPNILLMVADDLGSADLGCYGNKSVSSPRIDKLAAEGVILTHHVTADSVCTPNRAAFYTGRYPKRMGMVSAGILSVNLFLAGVGGIPNNETTFAHLAKKAGYRTAIIGKWHLGLNCDKYGDWCHHPMSLGFDYYYGLPLTNLHDFGDDGLAVFWRNRPMYAIGLKTGALVGLISTIMLLYWRFNPINVLFFFLLFCLTPGFIYWLFANLRLLNSVLMRQYEIVEQPIILSDLTPRLVNEGTKFIEESVAQDKPFLVVMSWIQVHTALITMPQFRNRSKFGSYGDAIEELDWSVGKMLDVLDRLGVADDTFVYFGSDNAAHIEETDLEGHRAGGYNGQLRGGKFHSGLEGAVRVPGIIRWKNAIPAGGQSVPQVSTNMDIYSVISTIVKQKPPQSERYLIDGRDILPLLIKPNPTSPQRHEFLFHYCGHNVHAVRFIPAGSSKIYKYHLYLPNYIEGTEECYFLCRCGSARRMSPPVLYEISKDESERFPIDPATRDYKDIQALCEKALKDHENSIDPGIPSQFAWERQLWRPWLQPCCGGVPFPFCGCRDIQDIGDVVKDIQ